MCHSQKTSAVLLVSSRVKNCGSDNFAQLLDLPALKVTQAAGYFHRTIEILPYSAVCTHCNLVYSEILTCAVHF